ncbi:hypothetical protein [Methylobacterium nodulans]|uniref:Thioredoxin-like fold domain-containing protein n=1 Tax=Methylobacterium nodulans (strain LMG 21967 / CNCM I-2342 / ORS 2060) TaxID=460265 RepID=B8IFE2_METNO|nr:hypothetical protein [Methylobacterium nodulans]ACL57677.1 hypothetical protein Mnod_2721 [Methylobacterium nodulans ORS 2060]
MPLKGPPKACRYGWSANELWCSGRIQVAGVPFFIADGQWALSGAQPVEQWVEVLRGR